MSALKEIIKNNKNNPYFFSNIFNFHKYVKDRNDLEEIINSGYYFNEEFLNDYGDSDIPDPEIFRILLEKLLISKNNASKLILRFKEGIKSNNDLMSQDSGYDTESAQIEAYEDIIHILEKYLTQTDLCKASD